MRPISPPFCRLLALCCGFSLLAPVVQASVRDERSVIIVSTMTFGLQQGKTVQGSFAVRSSSGGPILGTYPEPGKALTLDPGTYYFELARKGPLELPLYFTRDSAAGGGTYEITVTRNADGGALNPLHGGWQDPTITSKVVTDSTYTRPLIEFKP
jgi:hypothetical protein